MSELIKKLHEQRANVWEQAKALADVAADEARAFSGEEEQSWTRLNADLDGLDARIAKLVEGEQRAQDAEAAMVAVRGVPAPKAPAEEARVSELRAFLNGDRGRAMEIAPTASVRDLVKGTATAGGNTVPTDFYGRLVEHMIEVSAILQSGATILRTDAGENLQIPKTTAHGGGAIVAEGAAITESDPTFGQITLGAYKYGVLIQVSRELVTDTGVDLEGYLARQAGRALGNAYGAHAITGDGSSKPRGVVTDATVGVTGGTGVVGAFTADNLIDLHYSVIAPYRNSPACKWILRDASVATIRKLKDTTNQYIWQPGLQAGAPDTILGKAVLVDPNVAATAVSAKSVVFGDFSQYFVRLVGGLRFERSEEYAFNQDLVTFRALMRADSALVDLTGAVKVFQGAAT